MTSSNGTVYASEERKLNGAYTGIENFVLRTGASIEQLVILIKVGAFRFLGIGKKELLWETHLLLSRNKIDKNAQVFFESIIKKTQLPKLEHSSLEDYYDEIELIGFAVSGTLFELARSEYRGDCKAIDLAKHEGKIVLIVGDFVAEKIVKTRRGDYMKFGTFFDVDRSFFDSIHFPQSLQHYPLRGAGIYLLEGKVVMEFSCPSLEVIKCGRMSLKGDPRAQ